MRKRLIETVSRASQAEVPSWFDLTELAEVEVTSEDPAHPIEDAFSTGGSTGWRAGAPGDQTIRLLFDGAVSVRRIELLFLENEVERHQEFALHWSSETSGPFREIVRQQYHFSPGGATRELEDYRVQLENVRVLTLTIIPDRSASAARATLARLRIA